MASLARELVTVGRERLDLRAGLIGLAVLAAPQDRSYPWVLEKERVDARARSTARQSPDAAARPDGGPRPAHGRAVGVGARLPASSHGPLLEAHDLVVDRLREAGLTTESIELPDTAPAVFAEIQAPAGAPTVLLHSHYDVVGYDVVGAGDEALWTTAPFEPVVTDDAVIGRGAADSKSNVIAIIGAIRAWGGRPPVGVKVVIDGLEEVGGGAFTTYPIHAPERFAADVVIVADLGNVRPGIPTLSVALRGMVNIEVEVRTLASAKHSGSFGGTAPDALIALLHALATLHDANGDVAVEGLLREVTRPTLRLDQRVRCRTPQG